MKLTDRQTDKQTDRQTNRQAPFVSFSGWKTARFSCRLPELVF